MDVNPDYEEMPDESELDTQNSELRSADGWYPYSPVQLRNLHVSFFAEISTFSVSFA